MTDDRPPLENSSGDSALITTRSQKNLFRQIEDRLEVSLASAKRIVLLIADFVIYLYGIYALTIRLLK